MSLAAPPVAASSPHVFASLAPPSPAARRAYLQNADMLRDLLELVSHSAACVDALDLPIAPDTPHARLLQQPGVTKQAIRYYIETFRHELVRRDLATTVGSGPLRRSEHAMNRYFRTSSAEAGPPSSGGAADLLVAIAALIAAVDANMAQHPVDTLGAGIGGSFWDILDEFFNGEDHE